MLRDIQIATIVNRAPGFAFLSPFLFFICKSTLFTAVIMGSTLTGDLFHDCLHPTLPRMLCFCGSLSNLILPLPAGLRVLRFIFYLLFSGKPQIQQLSLGIPYRGRRSTLFSSSLLNTLFPDNSDSLMDSLSNEYSFR